MLKLPFKLSAPKLLLSLCSLWSFPQASWVTILLDGEEKFEVQLMLNDRNEPNKRSKSYLVRWTGYGLEHDTWEPECNLQNCTVKIQAYWDEQRHKTT